jgi:hypothetical protein
MNTALDFDGVIMNIAPVIIAWYRTQFGIDIAKGCEHEFDFNVGNYGYDGIQKAINEWQHKALPFNGADNAVREFYRRHKRPINIVTARSISTIDGAKEWWKEWIDVPVNFNVVHTHGSKVKFFEENPCYHYVDDRFRTCEQVAKIIPNVYCMNQHWNAGRLFKHPDIRRIDSLHEFNQLRYK